MVVLGGSISPMDLTSDHPFWAVKDGLLAHYPPLDADIRYEVAVLGAGITRDTANTSAKSPGLVERAHIELPARRIG